METLKRTLDKVAEGYCEVALATVPLFLSSEQRSSLLKAFQDAVLAGVECGSVLHRTLDELGLKVMLSSMLREASCEAVGVDDALKLLDEALDVEEAKGKAAALLTLKALNIDVKD